MDRWKIGQCVRRGLRHQKDGSECQDYIFHAEDENCIVLALCDGLGSLPASALAAKYTAVAACRILQQCATYDFRRFASEKDGLLRDLLERVDAALEKRLGEQEIARNQADSTLAFVFISKTFRFCYAACLGDSAVCLIKRSGNECLTESNSMSESTASVDMKEPWTFAVHRLIGLDNDDLLGAILTSDGLDGDIYTKDSTLVFRAADFYFNAALSESFETTVGERLDLMQAEYGDFFDDDISVAVLSRAVRPVRFPPDPTWLCRCGGRNELTETYCSHCGSDFIDVYRHVDLTKYGGKARFFRSVNRRPAMEKRIVGIPASVPVAPANPEAEVRRPERQQPDPAAFSRQERGEAQRPLSAERAVSETEEDGQAEPPRAGGEKRGIAEQEQKSILPEGQLRRRQKRILIASASAGAAAVAVGITAAAIHRSSHKPPENDD